MKRSLVFILFVSFTALAGHSQDDFQKGFVPYQAYDSNDFDSVNLSNGNLVLHIPLLSYPQRGHLPPINLFISGNGSTWVGEPSQFTSPWYAGGVPPIGRPTLSFSPMMRMMLSQSSNQANSTQNVYMTTGIVLDSMGASHYFAQAQRYGPINQNPNFPVSPGSGTAVDGSGITGAFGVAMDADGNIWKGGGALRSDLGTSSYTYTATDLSGNTITPLKDSSGNVVSVTDSIGRNIPTPPIAWLGDLPTVQPGCTTLNYPGQNGGVVPLQFCFQSYNIATSFGRGTEFTGSWTMLQSVTLPNNTTWAFTYNNFGDVASITTPTGATISYTYGNRDTCDSFEVFSNQDPSLGTGYSVNRSVKSRTVDAHDGTPVKVWNYNYSNGYVNTVTDPTGNDTVHTFTLIGGAFCSPYETKTQSYQGLSSNHTLIRTVDTQYSDGGTVPFHGGSNTRMAVFPNQRTTTFPNGQVSAETYNYDSGCSDTIVGTNGAPTQTFSFSCGRLTQKSEFDYGTNGPGSLLRQTVYQYEWQANSAYPFNTPCVTTVYGPGAVPQTSGCTPPAVQANQLAQTVYAYDENNGSPQGVFANLTSSTSWLNGGTSAVSSTVYNAQGMPIQKTDPNSHTTTTTYDATGIFPSHVQQPDTSGVHHIEGFVYDANTGEMTSHTGENGEVTSYLYDNMRRIKNITYPPGGGSETYSYNDSIPNPQFTFTRSIDSTHTFTKVGIVDGLGRMTQSQVTSDPDGTDYVDISYDSLGRLQTVSNPHRLAASPTDGVTTYQYDALGRVIQVAPPDGTPPTPITPVTLCLANNVCTQYKGNATVVTDQAGNQRGSIRDALGRLIEADEPSGGAVSPHNYATMQTDGNFVIYNPSGAPQWSTGTGGTNASSIMMQDDGNLVLYIFKWQAGTYTTPSPGPFPAASCSIGSYLMANQRLNANQCIASPHGQYFLYMAPDGNFFIYDQAHNVGTWGPGTTYGHPGAYAIMQGDGNLCVYDANNVYLWCSGTNGTFAERLDMEDDGRIIIYKSAWNSGTSDGQYYGTVIPHPSCDVGTGTGWTGVLGSGSCFVSPNGNFELLMQNDGNLVIYNLGTAPQSEIWNAGTAISSVDPSVAMRTLYTYDGLSNLTCVEQHGTATTGTGCSAPASNDATSPWRVRRFAYDSLSRLLTATNPESGTVSYSYDPDSNLLTKTSPAPNQTGSLTQIVSYCYDALNRVTGKAYGAQSCPLTTPVVTYSYDSGANAIGHLTSLIDQAGTSSYTYDTLGRLASETRTLTGANNAAISNSLSYDYNLDGSLYKLHYPSGAVITYAPSAAGLPLSAIDSGSNINYVTGATYGPDKAITGFVSGNSGTFSGITNAFSYNKRLQPLSMSATAPSQTVLSLGYDFHLGASNNGNVWGITNYKDTTRNQTFTYDALNRLTAAQNTGTDCTATVLQNKTKFWGNSYVYDAWGNLLQKNVTKCNAEYLQATADAQNRIHVPAPDYFYDAAGNMTTDVTDGMTSVYDQENRVSTATSGSITTIYTYDADGNRVRKSTGNLAANGTLYWYMTPGLVAESDLAGTTKSEYIFFDGKRVARRDGATGMGGVFYYFSDHLKNASVITDSAGVIKAESDYYPWGGELQFVNNDTNDYKFTGKKRDVETGLDYFGARYYSNGLGRFVSADWSATPEPVPYADLNNPQTLNLYRYPSNPETTADLDGHCDWCQRAWNRLWGYGWKTDAEVEIQIERDFLIKQQVQINGKQKDYSKASDEEVQKDFKIWQDAHDHNRLQQHDSVVQPMAPGERVLHRDSTGRLHADLPEYPDPKMSKAELEEQAHELRESIKAREIDTAQKGGDASSKGPSHPARIDEERHYLNQIENRLKGLK